MYCGQKRTGCTVAFKDEGVIASFNGRTKPSRTIVAEGGI